MASVGISRSPFSEELATLSASTQLENTQKPLPSLSLRRKASVQSHYRPHSTLCVQDGQHPDPGPSKRNSILGSVFRYSSANRPSSSFGGLSSSSSAIGMGLGMMKKSLSENTAATTLSSNTKGKMKEKAKELPKLRIRKLSDNAVVPVVVSPPAVTTTTKMSRPRTSSGAVEERASISSRLLAQRSVASLRKAAAAGDVSPNPVLLESTPKVAAYTPPLSSSRSSHSTMEVDRHHHHPTTPLSAKRGNLKPSDNTTYKVKERGRPAGENVWLNRSGTKMHPYSGQVPYMQAHDTTSLDNDWYTELLLRRLNPSSPSFLDFGKRPPVSVLDLGCGRGYWCLWASSVWRNTRIIGIDMVDVTHPAIATTENVVFVRANFLCALPFADGTFEYVRMCNLSHCIPSNHWKSILGEVRRVLTHGGRLEIIDDQIYFPYGEEPKLKVSVSQPQTPTATNPVSGSFMHFGEDSDSDGGDTLEEAASSSTASTLVNEFEANSYFEKMKSSPGSSKRSSAQSNPGVPQVIEEEEESVEPPLSLPEHSVKRDKSLPVPNNEMKDQELPPLAYSSGSDTFLGPAISPSPTITQDNINALEEEVNLPSSATFTRSPISSTLTLVPDDSPAKGHKRHRRNKSSVSSTGSNAEAISTWKQRQELSMNMETIFESILLNHGIHPRPAEVMEKWLRELFGNRTGKKVASFHIKLAPFDSPIGPGAGGALAPWTTTPPERPGKLAADARMMSSDHLKKHWMQIADKERRKERKQEKQERKEARERAMTLNNVPEVPAKAASRLGIKPTVPPLPPLRRISAESSTGSDSSHSSNGSSMPQMRSTSGSISSKAASRLGIQVPAAAPLSSSRSGEGNRPAASRNFSAPTPFSGQAPPKSASRSGPPSMRPVSRSISAGYSRFGLPVLTPADALELDFDSPAGSQTGSDEGSEDSDKMTLSPNGADPALPSAPPQPSAKAAGRLGISYSVLAAASAAQSRGSGVMAPVQSPGLLVWPNTYIAVSPIELEMHACKFIQVLLGCKHALKEYITGDFKGQRLATGNEFEEAIWEYECFRRSRFLWPHDHWSDIFEKEGYPEPPPLDAPAPPRQATSPTTPGPILKGSKGHSRSSSLDSFNGQYRRDDMTHIRTIRVFEAIKDENVVALLMNNAKQA